METPSLPRVVLYALAVTIGLGLVVAASTTGAAFGAYNPAWDGTSDVRELADRQADSRVILNTSTYESVDPESTVAVVLSPETAYTANDTQRIQAFVATGGTLVVAEDFGPHGNALLADIGANARFNGTRLRDEREYYRAPSLPVATNISDTPYTTGVEQLTLNGATAIDANNTTVIATSSPFGYLDRNATGGLSPTDELGTYPVVTVEPIGDGRVISVSDPSIFINTMLSQPDNEAFATALIGTSDRVLLDYSRAGAQPPLAVAVLWLRAIPWLQVVLAAVGIGVVWRYGQQRPGRLAIGDQIRRRLPARIHDRLPPWLRGSTGTDTGPVDETAILAALRQQYPAWDEHQLRRVMTDVLSERSREEENE